ncbi:MAG: LysR family transcriptional regulator [Nevskiaceae bacterium]|nr:MAG: LysR family transcriptional regulator [Nevskiaceae bacterium]TAM32740.1 MAG: LysR family transcriptional regulator [Nevskiaceae bacterium]
MKFRRLPPLHTLEAFEQAARTGSFKTAAAALHLTPSAVSHQIKALEAHLGFALFRRGNRSLELSEGGKAYLQVVEDSLRRLREGSARVAERHARARLKLSMGDYIANEIVVPALPAFQERHPQIELVIGTSLRAVDLLHEDIDIALRFGDGHWPKLACHRLLAVDAVAVCDAATAEHLRPLGPAALGEVALIHSSAIPEGWPDWSRAVGQALGKPRRELWLDSYASIMRAAAEGGGLALGMVPIINPWLRSGRLVSPWPQLRAPIPQGYYLLHRQEDGGRPEVAAFHRWLVELLSGEAMQAVLA